MDIEKTSFMLHAAMPDRIMPTGVNFLKAGNKISVRDRRNTYSPRSATTVCRNGP